MSAQQLVLDNPMEVLRFLGTRVPLYHLSNVFARDLQYGIRAFLETRGARIGYTEAEAVTSEFTALMERKKIFKNIDAQTWVLENEEFRTPRREPAAKAAAPSPARQAPAA